MPTTITRVDVRDVRFPTSANLDGSDAMNVAPDYSAAYVVLQTDSSRGLSGHGFAFTTGRGNEVVVCAIRALAPMILGRSLEDIASDLGAFWRHLTGDSQLRWIGPDKGVIHLATAAIVNAVWDLYAKSEQKPLWKLLADMTPQQLVSCVDFRYITDALTPAEAIDLLNANHATKPLRDLTVRCGSEQPDFARRPITDFGGNAQLPATVSHRCFVPSQFPAYGGVGVGTHYLFLGPGPGPP